MPANGNVPDTAAFEVLCDSLAAPTFEETVKAKSEDVTFLSELLNNLVVFGLVQAHETLEEPQAQPVSCDNIDLLKDICDYLVILTTKNNHARDLYAALSNPHIQSLIEAHDDVAAKNYEVLPEEFPLGQSMLMMPSSQIFPLQTTDAIRMVGIRKNPDEPLGITIRSEEYGLVVARILEGSMIDKQGLLHVGDIIKEVNGTEVTTADEMFYLMKKSNGNITLKILPTSEDMTSTTQIFLKAHFNYDPKRDNLIPCRDAGLTFKSGDILQVTNKDDPNWWQARLVGSEEKSMLIPSQTLEEKRKAFVRPEYDYTQNSLLCGLVNKKKKKLMYQTKQNKDFNLTELAIYEEVARMPPFHRKTLVLIGAQGVGRRTLKQRLILADPTRFAAVLPHTNRPMKPGEVNGEVYWFETTDEFMQDLANGLFLEHGEFEGYYYGIKLNTIRQCLRSGQMCILDISPQAIKAIKVAEFMPYVVFISAAPIEIQRNMYEYARMQRRTDKYKTEKDFRHTFDESTRIERQYKNYFDFTIVNNNFDEAYNRLRKAIEDLSTQPQWVPITWVY